MFAVIVDATPHFGDGEIVGAHEHKLLASQVAPGVVTAVTGGDETEAEQSGVASHEAHGNVVQATVKVAGEVSAVQSAVGVVET